MDLFKKALKFVLKWEGGYVNNPYDKGGATNYGITQNTYNNWLISKSMSTKDVKYITYEEVESIYYHNYWLKAKCNQMSPAFAILVFDTAVNMGITRANKFIEEVGTNNPELFIKARELKYQEFAKYGNQKIFLKGWLNRLNALAQFIKQYN